MKMLIRIVFIIFIVEGINSLGSVCDDCCDCLKGKNKKINSQVNSLGNNNSGYFFQGGNKNQYNYKNKKEETVYEEIDRDKKNIVGFLVKENWFNGKGKDLELKIFLKKDDNSQKSKNNGVKISIKLIENSNYKIEYQEEKKVDPLF